MKKRTQGTAAIRPSRRRRGSRLTLEQLRVFVAVAELEHLTRAARAMRLGQGSVSTQVRRLERALGVPLLNRVGRNIRVTDAGRRVQSLALEVIKQAEAIENLAAGYQRGQQGQMSVAAGLVIGAHRISSWLAPFVQAHPRIDLRIAIMPMARAVDELSNGRVDVAILGMAVQSPAFEAISLERTELVLVVAADHALAHVRNPMSQLANHRYLSHEHGSGTQQHAPDVVRHHADLAATIELEEGALLAALHTGLGFAVMPRAVVESDIASGRLVVLHHGRHRVPAVFSALRRKGDQNPVVGTFWEHLRSVSLA
jgi:DNA-binding transcriptional LysR family regulator